MKDTSKVYMLDDTFSSYLIDGNPEDFCKNIGAILHAIDCSKQFRVSIMYSLSQKSEPFFGMRIFPDKTFTDELLKDMTEEKRCSIGEMCDRWRSIPVWEIEIDDRVFDREDLSFNPKELTAMLLHELGHTIYSDKKFEMFYRVFKEAQIRLKTSERASTKILYCLYIIPLCVMCGLREWNVSEKMLREEVFADQSVKKMGYGAHLISAFQKIVKVYGSNGYRSPKEAENAISNSINLCNLNITDILHRKEKLKDELYHTGIMHNSIYIKKAISNIMKKFGVARRDKYEGNVVLEQFTFDGKNLLEKNSLVYDFKTFQKLSTSLQMAKNSAAMEMFLKRKEKRPNIPSQLDVDTLFVEVDRIQNHADRRYVLDLIYNQEEKIERFLEFCEEDETMKAKYDGKMHAMLRELQEMRKAVLAKRNFDKSYKLFVKYPEGYEG